MDRIENGSIRLMVSLQRSTKIFQYITALGGIFLHIYTAQNIMKSCMRMYDIHVEKYL